MKVAIMQPYFFPYIGYFQLIKEVDIFVIYDDVNYIKKGWINRNRILLNNNEYLLTLPISKQSQNMKINNIEIFNSTQSKKYVSDVIRHAYGKTQTYKKIGNLLNEKILNEEINLSNYICNNLEVICNYLNIDTKIIKSSSLNKNNCLKGQEKIIEICKILKADTYVNLSGGVDLYSKNEFNNNFIELKFIKCKPIEYNQNNGEFIPNLSILDVIFLNDKDKVIDLLNEYYIF